MKNLLLIFIGAVVCLPGRADDLRYQTRLSPHDYLWRSEENYHDPVFDEYRTVDLGADIGVGSDCGRIDFTNTLRASLKNILDTKYFGDLGKNIIASSPMLLACYFSPTWCAILKHSQVSAHYISQMRLDQCSLIDKYTDNRVEDFYQERQGGVRRAIEENGGDLEHAMETCRGNKLWDQDLPNWAGKLQGAKVSENRLIESSAKWAGFDSSEGKKSVDLLKAFVGDTVVFHGNGKVDYGPRQSSLTPRMYLQTIEKKTFEELCTKIMRRADNAEGRPIDALVTDDELQALTPQFKRPLIDRQTLRALGVMSPKERFEACKALSDSVSMSVFSSDVNRSLEMLTTLSQNPNLPPNRKQEIEQKRQGLKDQVDLTLKLRQEQAKPVGEVMQYIAQEGLAAQDEATRENLVSQSSVEMKASHATRMNDCADGVFCDHAPNFH